MGRTYEGVIEIELAEFWDWLIKNHLPATGDMIQFGVPRVNLGNDTLEISYAGADQSHPADWATKSTADQEWAALKSNDGVTNQ